MPFYGRLPGFTGPVPPPLLIRLFFFFTVYHMLRQIASVFARIPVKLSTLRKSVRKPAPDAALVDFSSRKLGQNRISIQKECSAVRFPLHHRKENITAEPNTVLYQPGSSALAERPSSRMIKTVSPWQRTSKTPSPQSVTSASSRVFPSGSYQSTRENPEMCRSS